VKAKKRALAVSWKPPASNGGAAITGYRLGYSANRGKTWKTITVPARTKTGAAKAIWAKTIKKLKPNRKYAVRVAAVNAAGLGGYTVKRHPVKPKK
jgi:hypothetical protein